MLYWAALQLLWLATVIAQDGVSPYCSKTGFLDKPMVVCDWTEWTACCYPKTKEIKQMSYRYRTHFDCTGAENFDYEFQECPHPYSAWSEWSDCEDLTCGGKGFLYRSRQVCQGQFEDQIENFACSIGYIGDNCDTCDANFYLMEDDCLACNCDCLGSGSGGCTNNDGICTCKIGYTGTKCNQCDEGFYRDEEGHCIECGCDATKGSQDVNCDLTGKCTCKDTYTGLKCDMCQDNYYLDASGLCQSCTCNSEGTNACLAPTGTCLCNEQHTGDTCSDCATNYYRDSNTNVCTICPPGWFYLKQSCYFVHGEKLPFIESKAKCQDLGSKLFEPMSEEQNVDIFNVMVAMYGEDCEYYVGISIDEATDNGSLVYVSNGNPVNIDIFGASQDSVRNGVDHCVAIDNQNFGLMWADRYCSDQRVFVCEKP